MGDAISRHFVAGNVNEDGIVRGPAFDLENFCDRLFVQRVRGEAVNGFRRQRHNFTGAQQFGGTADSLLKKRRSVS